MSRYSRPIFSMFREEDPNQHLIESSGDPDIKIAKNFGKLLASGEAGYYDIYNQDYTVERKNKDGDVTKPTGEGIDYNYPNPPNLEPENYDYWGEVDGNSKAYYQSGIFVNRNDDYSDGCLDFYYKQYTGVPTNLPCVPAISLHSGIFNYGVSKGRAPLPYSFMDGYIWDKLEFDAIVKIFGTRRISGDDANSLTSKFSNAFMTTWTLRNPPNVINSTMFDFIPFWTDDIPYDALPNPYNFVVTTEKYLSREMIMIHEPTGNLPGDHIKIPYLGDYDIVPSLKFIQEQEDDCDSLKSDVERFLEGQDVNTKGGRSTWKVEQDGGN